MSNHKYQKEIKFTHHNTLYMSPLYQFHNMVINLVIVPVVPTQGAIPEKGRYKKKTYQLLNKLINSIMAPWLVGLGVGSQSLVLTCLIVL